MFLERSSTAVLKKMEDVSFKCVNFRRPSHKKWCKFTENIETIASRDAFFPRPSRCARSYLTQGLCGPLINVLSPGPCTGFKARNKICIFGFAMKLNLPDKLYYSIGEVARAFDVNTSLIRYWEQEFPILMHKKNKKGNRYFTNEDIKNLKIIYHLVKEKGYTLDGARIALTTNSKVSSTVSMIDRLEFVKSELLKLKDSLVEKPREEDSQQ